MKSSLLAVVLLALLGMACLPQPMTSCRTTDDCAQGRVCVAGTCQSPVYDSGVDASVDRQLQSEVDGLIIVDAHDTLGDLDVQTDVQLTIDVPIDAAEEVLNFITTDAQPLDIPLANIDAGITAPDGLKNSTDTEKLANETNIDAGITVPDGAVDLAQPLVSWEDFRAQCPREPWSGGRYIVDGDLPFDEAGLRKYYDSWFASAIAPPETMVPMGSITRWPSPDCMSLAYCISTDFGANFNIVRDAMVAAASSWSDLVGVQFIDVSDENQVCNGNNTNVIFDVRPVFNAGYAAVSFFPDSSRSVRSLLIDSSAFTTNSMGIDLVATLRHQLGHTLGFQHEHVWLVPTCTSVDRQWAVQIATYDIDSIMHLPSCRSNELGGLFQTENDRIGAVTIYGLSPALIETLLF